MAIPDTTNTATLFVSREPSWELGVDLTQILKSDVQTSRSGLEQRQGRMSLSRWRMSYQAHLSSGERAARLTRMLAEIRAPLQVPFWARGAVLTSDMALETLGIDRHGDADFYRPGDYVMITDGVDLQFRIIAAIYFGNSITLEPMDGSIDFTQGSRIYPCRLCVRDGGTGEFREMSEATHLEKLNYSTL